MTIIIDLSKGVSMDDVSKIIKKETMFICDDCGKATPLAKKIIRPYDTDANKYYDKPKQLCYDCACRRKP